MTTTTFYKHVPVEIPYSYMKYVVGKQGQNLKHCCKKTGVNSVWYNVKRNIVEIYGPADKLDGASRYITRIMNNVKNHKVPGEEMYGTATATASGDDEETSVEGSLNGAMDKDEVRYLIGRRGVNFKKITTAAGVSFIWYDEDKHAIVIWGPKNRLSEAVSLLFKKIAEVKEALTNKHGAKLDENDGARHLHKKMKLAGGMSE